MTSSSPSSGHYFSYPTAAERYASGRPYLHADILERFHGFVRPEQPFRQVLDVGCGTGQSTLAAAEFAQEVVGVDLSHAMLAQAPAHPRARYLQAPAEQLPFTDGSFDLLTVGLAVHWFDQAAFFQEAKRLIYSDGWLLLYNTGFTGEMRENPDFAVWNKQDYLARYPTPPRNYTPSCTDRPEEFGFVLRGRDNFILEVALDLSELIAYLTTQTNVIAAVEQGGEPIETAAAWIETSAAPYFEPGQKRTFTFSATSWYLQRS